MWDLFDKAPCIDTRRGSNIQSKCKIRILQQTNNQGTALNYNDVTMSSIASQITSLTIVYSTVYSDADQRKH